MRARAGEPSVGEVFELLNTEGSKPWHPNYNRYYIGVTDGSKSSTFVFIRPRKKFLHLRLQFAGHEEWLERIEDAGLTANLHNGRLIITIQPGGAKKHADLLRELLAQARKDYEG